MQFPPGWEGGRVNSVGGTLGLDKITVILHLPGKLG